MTGPGFAARAGADSIKTWVLVVIMTLVIGALTGFVCWGGHGLYQDFKASKQKSQADASQIAELQKSNADLERLLHRMMREKQECVVSSGTQEKNLERCWSAVNRWFM
jgi:cell division protein FtsB